MKIATRRRLRRTRTKLRLGVWSGAILLGAASAVVFADYPGQIPAGTLLGNADVVKAPPKPVTLVAGTGVSINHSGTSFTINATGSGGTVTSVGLSLPAIFSVLGSPVTSNGTLSASLASQTQNLIWASPNGSSGAPTFRALVLGDLPSIACANLSIAGTACTAATGTSGATLPFLNGTNTWSGTQTFGTVKGTQSTQSGTTYTLAATDCGTVIRFSSGSAITVTTLNSIAVGCTINLLQGGAGQITVADGSGATHTSAHTYTKTFGQNAILTLFVDANSGGTAANFNISGDGA